MFEFHYNTLLLRVFRPYSRLLGIHDFFKLYANIDIDVLML